MKAHRTDLVSLAFGLVFVALAAWWLLAQLLGLDLPPVGWFLAGGLILIGLLGLVGALRSGRSDRNTDATRPTPEETVAVDLGDGPGTDRPGAPDTGGAGLADPPGTGVSPAPADEWSTGAATDGHPGAVEERPVSGAGGAPRWSPTDPLDDEAAGGSPSGPATERVTEPLPRLTDPTAVAPTVDPTASSTPDAPLRGPGRADG